MIVLVWAIAGAGASALAWFAASGRGFGLLGGAIVGAIGAALATWALPRLGFLPEDGLADDYMHSAIGAAAALAVAALRVRPSGPGNMFMGFRPR